MPKKNKSRSAIKNKRIKPIHIHLSAATILIITLVVIFFGYIAARLVTLDTFKARPFFTVKSLGKIDPKVATKTSPLSMRTNYNLSGQGSGTIAIIDAYDNPSIETDLAVFNSKYGLSSCTTANGCFEKHKMNSKIAVNSSWAMEIALDIEWAHAIAPGAKILLVEASSNSGTDLLSAVNYAASRNDVKAISMSWGGSEFTTELNYENNFTSKFGANFFAASGDSGHITSWPSVSANVISVGGTTLNYNAAGAIISETAWSGSGGGLSSYIKEPTHQISANIPQSKGYRATPDVSYNADPNSGYPVYMSTSYLGLTGWFLLGGTSAGAPQWAAISTISGTGFNLGKIYNDASKVNQKYFKDITTGKNGSCGYYCNAQSGFDYVTGLGSPVTTSF